MGAHEYALTIASAASVSTYLMSVTTAGRVGVGVALPLAPLEVNSSIMVSNWTDTDSFTHIYANGGKAYTRWSDNGLAGFGNASLGAMGYLTQGFARPFIFQALGTSPGVGGSEVFRINLDAADITSGSSWRFGIGTSNPLEKFHVAANMLVSTSTLSPILYISTATGLVGVGSSAPDHKLSVNGGILATSSVTAQGGFFGDGAGLTNISAGGLPAQVDVSSIAARSDSAYGAVVFTSNTYVNANLAVGEIFPTVASPLHLRGVMTIDQKDSEGYTNLNFALHNGGPAFINWSEGGLAKGSLGMPAVSRDLVFTINNSNEEVFRVKGKPIGDNSSGWKFGIGTSAPLAPFHVATDMLVGNGLMTPALFVSTISGSVGISTGAPKERMHVASSFLVGSDRASAALYVSTLTGYSFTGVGTGNPRALLEVGDGNILAAGIHDDITPAPLPVTGAGTRFMWIPKDSAIRAGAAIGTEWDTIGKYSVAFGRRSAATGESSVVTGGYNNAAAGAYSAITGGHNNISQGQDGGVLSGESNYLTAKESVIPGGGYNVVLSSYAFAGGFNNYLDTGAEGTFAWGNDNVNGTGYVFNTFKINTPYLFLIDPANARQYKVGIRTHSPQAALDVNGDAQFGAGATKSTFTAEGYWQPRAMTTAEMQGVVPSVMGAVVFNSSIGNICFSTGTVNPGDWAIAGSKANCY